MIEVQPKQGNQSQHLQEVAANCAKKKKVFRALKLCFDCNTLKEILFQLREKDLLKAVFICYILPNGEKGVEI